MFLIIFFFLFKFLVIDEDDFDLVKEFVLVVFDICIGVFID